MDWQVIASGFVIGIAVAAPIGPINLMAIRNTLAHGIPAGVFTGTGAVLGDGTFAVFAAYGITAVSRFVIDYAAYIQGAGGVVLVAVGLNIMRAPQELPPNHPPSPGSRPITLIGTTYLLTITNPATLMGFIAIFGGVGNLVSRPGDYAGAGAMVAAVMLGSLAWWFIISWLASLLRHRLAQGALRYVNWGSGAVIVLFGLAIFVRLFLQNRG